MTIDPQTPGNGLSFSPRDAADLVERIDAMLARAETHRNSADQAAAAREARQLLEELTAGLGLGLLR